MVRNLIYEKQRGDFRSAHGTAARSSESPRPGSALLRARLRGSVFCSPGARLWLAACACPPDPLLSLSLLLPLLPGSPVRCFSLCLLPFFPPSIIRTLGAAPILWHTEWTPFSPLSKVMWKAMPLTIIAKESKPWTNGIIFSTTALEKWWPGLRDSWDHQFSAGEGKLGVEKGFGCQMEWE